MKGTAVCLENSVDIIDGLLRLFLNTAATSSPVTESWDPFRSQRQSSWPPSLGMSPSRWCTKLRLNHVFRHFSLPGAISLVLHRSRIHTATRDAVSSSCRVGHVIATDPALSPPRWLFQHPRLSTTTQRKLKLPFSCRPTLLSLASRASFASRNSSACAWQYGFASVCFSRQDSCASASPTMPSLRHRSWNVPRRSWDGVSFR